MPAMNMQQISELDSAFVLAILGCILIGLGLLGTVLPVLPGPPLIWAGAFIWAWGDGFQRVGWITLTLLGMIAIVAMASDMLATTMTGRKSGLSWRAIGAAIIGGFTGGIIGAVLLSVLPLVGTLFGGIVGAVLGAMGAVTLVEGARTKDWAQAWKSGKVFMLGYILGRLVEISLCLLMIVVFIISIVL